AHHGQRTARLYGPRRPAPARTAYRQCRPQSPRPPPRTGLPPHHPRQRPLADLSRAAPTCPTLPHPPDSTLSPRGRGTAFPRPEEKQGEGGSPQTQRQYESPLICPFGAPSPTRGAGRTVAGAPPHSPPPIPAK